ncbi:hypothetical protein [Agriterribacter sp.]|uniref:hypothetical protein n=1 Tax=Agriterribacter sp. TaxID=2821509 RepID=UPI002C42478D|nr:hypothetical protein [Agriterribacter sp.]HTN09234.1 hypothetical protein [Agriterribacter sp.]
MAKSKKEKIPEYHRKAMQRADFADILSEIENYPFISAPGGRKFKNKRESGCEEFELKPLIKQIRFWPTELITAFIRVQGSFREDMNTPVLVAIFETLHQNSHEGRERHRLLRWIDDTF